MQVIPPKIKGKNVDLSETKTGIAKDIYDQARYYLMHPHTWYEICGGFGGKFSVFKNGTAVNDEVSLRDFIRIDIPGPDNDEGRGYDWVKVEKLMEENNSIGMTVVACASPVANEKTSAHFFEAGSSSSFIIEMKDDEVVASYHGRNETINNETDSIVDNIRNTVIGLGALIGLSERQWKKLLKGFLEK